jgi:hypothetical protein
MRPPEFFRDKWVPRRPTRVSAKLATERSGQVETWSYRIFQNKWLIWIHPEGKNRTEDE